ncbi:MAG: hypothetical protein RLZZ555_958 [Pseudomonadota bacterium]|jgi:predicted porin
MKLITKAAAVAALILATAGANAQLYGELSYTDIRDKFSVGSTEYKTELGAISGIIGYGVHENLAVEGMLGLGVKDDTLAGLKAELEHNYGIFVKPRVMLSPDFELFGRLGYLEHKTKLGGISDTDGDWAYGLGANYYFKPNAYGTLSYMRLYDKDGEKANGLTLGLGMKF